MNLTTLDIKAHFILFVLVFHNSLDAQFPFQKVLVVISAIFIKSSIPVI